MALIPVRFEEALAATEHAARHLLLGNGFSIAVHRDFGYPALYRYASRADPGLTRFFPDPENPNFEHALARAADEGEADAIRKALIKAVAAVHPKYALSLSAQQRDTCRRWLQLFAGSDRPDPGWVFTTNYDLLLHWVASSQSKSPGTKQHGQLKLHDGFTGAGEWREGVPSQAYYLHGAVHINQFWIKNEGGPTETWMLRYSDGGRLKDQVGYNLDHDQFPVFVAASTAAEKQRIQRRWSYLRTADKRFQSACRDPGATLFTFGHSFGPSDDHIVGRIGEGRISRLYLGLFSDADWARAEQLATLWSEARDGLRVHGFDARACAVWKPLALAERNLADP